jgi:peptidoglycan/LPS O-acetylase OafA/YrhL
MVSDVNPLKVGGEAGGFTLCESSSLLLDMLRGAASEAVVVGHGLVIFGVASIPPLQNSAVVVFFLLSGFIIPYSTFMKVKRDPAYGFWAYFIDRFSRIYVGFVPGLVFVALLDGLSWTLYPQEYAYPEAFDVKTFVGNLLMLQDYPAFDLWARFADDGARWITSFGSARPFWTVAVEWWIYMAFGVLALAGPSRRRSVAYWAAFALVAVVPAYNLIGGRGNGLALMWAMGLLVYWMVSRSPVSVRGGRDLAIGLALVPLAVARLLWVRTPFDVLFAFILAASLFFVLKASQAWEPRMPRFVSAPVKAVADYSYTLYLVHYSILAFLLHWKGAYSNVALLAAGFVASNVISFVLYALCECRYRQVGARLKKALLARKPAPSMA